MGRIFEKRKYKMFARFARMSKAFNRIGRDINIAVKAGGPYQNQSQASLYPPKREKCKHAERPRGCGY